MFDNLTVEIQEKIARVESDLCAIARVSMSREQVIELRESFNRPMGAMYSKLGLKEETRNERRVRRYEEARIAKRKW